MIVRHAAYAGAFTWGRRAVVKSRAIEGRRGTGRVEVEPEKCPVFLRDNHAAYLTWEEYLANRERLRTQRQRGPNPGPQRDTKATLAGLVVCGRCGARVQTRYGKSLRYQCQRRALDEGAEPCPSFAGEPLERLVREQVLRVVTPAGLELCLLALEHCASERALLDKNWRLRLERANHDAERAFRQYDAVEPENRLVARTLERAWEAKLLTVRQLKEEYDRFAQAQPLRLSVAERAWIESLATDLPALWNSPRTAIVDQRQVMRMLIERVTVWPPSTASPARTLKVHLHWVGGSITEHEVTRTVAAWRQLPELPEVFARIRRGRAQGKSSKEIAAELNATGQLTPRGQPYSASTIRQLQSRLAGRKPKKQRRDGRKRRDGGAKK